jgi:hypothetical protein
LTAKIVNQRKFFKKRINMNKITFKTNYNNKLDCICFIHIAAAPMMGIPESQMNQVYLIDTEDGSHPGKTFTLIDFARIPLKNLRNMYTRPSHAVDADEFILSYVAANPGVLLETEVAIYFYLSAEY